MNRRLAFFLVLASTFGLANAAKAENSPYKHVLVIKRDNVSETTTARILEAMSRAGQRSFNRALGPAIYGRMATPEAQPDSQPLGVIANMIWGLDSFWRQELLSQQQFETSPLGKTGDLLRPFMGGALAREVNATTSSGSITIQVLTVPVGAMVPDPEPGSLAAGAKASGVGILGILLQAAHFGGTPRDYEGIKTLYNEAFNLGIVSPEQATTYGLYHATRQAYDDLGQTNPHTWYPLYLSFVLNVAQQKLTLHTDAIVKPANGLSKPLFGPDPKAQGFEKAVNATQLDYVPESTFVRGGLPAAMRLGFDDAFDFNAPMNYDALIHVQFGSLLDHEDIHNFGICVEDCARHFEPEHFGQFYPTVHGNLLLDRPEFFSDQIGKENAEKLGRKMTAALQHLNHTDEFHLLLQDLAINFTYADGITVLPALSSITLGAGRSPNIIQVNRGVAGIPALDVRLVPKGFDIYQMLAEKVAPALSAQANSQFNAAKISDQANQPVDLKASYMDPDSKDFDPVRAGIGRTNISILKAMKPITDLFATGPAVE